MLNKNKENLFDILEAIDKIILFSKDFKNPADFHSDRLHFDAVMMNIVIIGESTARISLDFQRKYNDIEWGKIKALRNIIAHDYFGIDAEEIWQIIKNKIPDLKNKVENILLNL